MWELKLYFYPSAGGLEQKQRSTLRPPDSKTWRDDLKNEKPTETTTKPATNCNDAAVRTGGYTTPLDAPQLQLNNNNDDLKNDDPAGPENHTGWTLLVV